MQKMKMQSVLTFIMNGLVEFFVVLCFIKLQVLAMNLPKGAFFDVQIDNLYQLEANLSINDWSGLKIRKISKNNQTRAIFGDAYLYIPFGNNIDVQIEAFKKQGGEYRLMPYRIPKQPYCEYIAQDPYYWKEVAEHSDFPEDVKNNCPIKPGKYTYRGVAFALDKLPKIIAPSGDYAIDLNFYIGADQILRHRLTAKVINVGI